MFRWVKGSYNPFDVHTTGTSYYDNFLTEKDSEYMKTAKNLTGKIVQMTPAQYFEECAYRIFDGTSVRNLKLQRKSSVLRDSGQRFVDKYAEDMKKGDKFPLCYLNYADDSQEGLHRMYAAGEAFGWDELFPVLVVDVYDIDRYNRQQLIKQCRDFERYDLDDLCDEACRELTDWSKPVPENIKELLDNKVEELAKKAGHEIEMDCEIETEGDSEGKIKFYMTKYGDYELSTCNLAYTYWLQDMFDYNNEDTSEDELDASELDDDLFLLDDLDI